MLSIKTVLVPFRMNLNKREPVSLRVEISNNTDEEKLLSYKLLVHKDLSVAKSAVVNVLEKRLGSLKPGESKLFYIDIYPKVSTRELDYPARFVVYEHYDADYSFILKEYKKNFTIKVVRF